MKDSVIKGEGNSRYLKSAISASATWEEARDALKSGTFPIDLNGINVSGYEVLGTPLNKANILTDDLAARMNLDGTATLLTFLTALVNAIQIEDERDGTSYVPKLVVNSEGYPTLVMNEVN